MARSAEPTIIQGGMGIGVSAWHLARVVSELGQLGVVSGTAVDVVAARRLQLGDPGGHMRRALADFPFPEMADRVLERYFIPGGKAANEPFRGTQALSVHPTQEQLELVVVANFVEVHLAKEGHGGLVGINLLEKIQTPTVPSLFGAMLAGVDFVLMGAGIPKHIPGVLDRLAEGKVAELPASVVSNNPAARHVMTFDPVAFCGGDVPWIERPRFLAIVASVTLATMLARKASGHVDGFVIEGPTAGGHNAPPRGEPRFNERGEPIYGERDVVDLDAFRAIGRPFWLAGSYGSPERVVEALDAGASGVQVGTAFAFCDESGMREDIRRRVLRAVRDGSLDVFTDAIGSPTGFPFKVLQLEGSMSQADVYARRSRVCDLGFLRHYVERSNGSIDWRCPAEPVDSFVRKGGAETDTVGRKCLCNGLMANLGLGQVRGGRDIEPPIITCGDDVCNIGRFLPTPTAESYSARDVVAHLLSLVESRQAVAVGA